MQLYTGSHWRVEAATLADVEHFTKFAVSPAPLLQLMPLSGCSWLCSIRNSDSVNILAGSPASPSQGTSHTLIRVQPAV